MANKEKKINRTTDIDKMLLFIEDLCWFLDSNKNVNFKKIPIEIKNLINQSVTYNEASDNNQMVNNLIGILPTLLKDDKLFSNNNSIVQFANEVLNLQISRWEKRSRFEIIGLIVCSVEEANQNRISLLTEWIAELLRNKEKIQNIQKESAEDIFSWNIALQKILGNKNE